MGVRRVPGRRVPDSRLVVWRVKDAARLERNLEVLQRIVVIERGKPTAHDMVHMDAIVFILASLMDLPGITDNHDKRAVIKQACFRLRTLKRQTLPTFRRVLAATVRRYLRLPERPHRIIFLLNVDHRDLNNRRCFRSAGLRFAVRRWQTIEDASEVKKWLREGVFHSRVEERILKSCFVPLEVTVPGRRFQDAHEAAQSAFELLRFTLNLNAFHRDPGRLSKPMGTVAPPPISGWFNEDGSYGGTCVEGGEPRHYLRVRLSQKRMNDADRLLRQFSASRRPNATVGVIEDAIRKYGRALDTTDWQDAFLSLWQALELLTYKPEADVRYSIRDVCERAGILLQKHALLTDILEACYATRNALVHQGTFPRDGLSEVAMLKAVVENCIDAVYGLRRTCSTWDSLVIYYLNASAQPRDLSERKRVINALLRSRTRSTKQTGQ